MSVNDWYWASGDTAAFLQLVPDMKRIIDHVIDTFLDPNLPVAWFGERHGLPPSSLGCVTLCFHADYV